MCGRLARRDVDGYHEAFGVAGFSESRILPRFNIAPTQIDLIIRAEPGERRLVESRWGLIPSWAKERSIGAKTFNARLETLPERPAFRGLIARQRCIVPASGYYEWQTVAGKKRPLYFTRADGAPLALAGLWTTWRDPASGETVTSHTIITREANGFMTRYHTRMPVILDRDAVAAWLDPALTDTGAALALLGPCPEDALVAHPVAPLVNNARNDGPELIEPVGAEP